MTPQEKATRTTIFVQLFATYDREPTDPQLAGYVEGVTAGIPCRWLVASVEEAEKLSGGFLPKPGEIWAGYQQLREAQRQDARLRPPPPALPAPRERYGAAQVVAKGRELRDRHPERYAGLHRVRARFASERDAEALFRGSPWPPPKSRFHEPAQLGALANALTPLGGPL